jgi:hypothetical protein
MKLLGFKWLAYPTLIAWALGTQAQEGPFVPCPDCESRINAPYPSSGAWANTELTGSGFNLQIQNGVVVGFHYGYNDQGEPEWLLFNGPLMPGPEDSPVQWQLEASLSRFSGGSCFDCAHQDPTGQDSMGTIRLEFMQRNHASFQFNDEEKQFMVPLLYGSGGYAHFAGQTPYLFPELGADGDDAVPWVLTFYDAESDDNLQNALIFHFLPSELQMWSEIGLVVGYFSQERLSLGSPPTPSAGVLCGDFAGGGNIECEVHFDTFFRPIVDIGPYRMPIGNLGANRFVAESEDGKTVEGFRLQYD